MLGIREQSAPTDAPTRSGLIRSLFSLGKRGFDAGRNRNSGFVVGRSGCALLHESTNPATRAARAPSATSSSAGSKASAAHAPWSSSSPA